MRKILFLLFSVFSLSAQAQSAAEEAIILNQELQFLEDSVSSVAAAPTPVPAESKVGENPVPESLERTYFSDEERDEVKLRTAAPKRRSF